MSHTADELYNMTYAMSQSSCVLEEWLRVARWIRTYLVNKYGENNFRVRYVDAIIANKNWAIDSMYRDGLRFLMHSEILGETEDDEKGHAHWLQAIKRRIKVTIEYEEVK